MAGVIVADLRVRVQDRAGDVREPSRTCVVPLPLVPERGGMPCHMRPGSGGAGRDAPMEGVPEMTGGTVFAGAFDRHPWRVTGPTRSLMCRCPRR